MSLIKRIVPPLLAAVLGTLLGVLASCGGPDTAPEADIVSASPDEIDPSRDDADDLSIVVEYTDGDGDLGGGIVDIYDCRSDGIVLSSNIPPIASDEAVGKGVPITGQLQLIVNDIGAIPVDDTLPPTCAELGAPPPSESQLVYCVVLTDAAGRVGDGACTEPVALLAAP